jgi:aerobic-type carbon monoxide dehydrogenase small subunit (CoxS/CutS family)
MREASSGTLCRCTGYQNVVAAVILAADRMRHGERSEAKARDVESCRQ